MSVAHDSAHPSLAKPGGRREEGPSFPSTSRTAFLGGGQRVLWFYFLLTLLFAGELLVPGRSLYRWDALFYNWPMLLETRAQWLAGRFPFWASSFCNGTPLWANANAGVLYPPKLLCWLLPLQFGYQLFLFVHVWAAFAAMHWLLRRVGRLSVPAAFVGALVYGTAGYARAMWDTHNFLPLPWIPLGLALLMGPDRPGRTMHRIAGVAVAWCMLALSGDLQAALLWPPVALLFVLSGPRRRSGAVVLLWGLVLGGLLAAPQLVPSWLAAADSYRAGGLGLAAAGERSFHPVRLLELLVPYLFGSRDHWFGATWSGAGATRHLPWVTSFHVGLLALLCAVAAWRVRQRPLVRAALILLPLTLLLSFGRFWPGFSYWQTLPLLRNFRYPEKYLLWSVFAFGILAAHGYSVLRAGWCRGVPRRIANNMLLRGWTVLILAGVVTAGAVGWRWVQPDEPAWAHWFILRAVTSLGVAAVALIALRLTRARTARLLCALMVVEALAWWYVERPTTRAFDPLATPAVARVVRPSDAAGGRYVRDRAARSAPLPKGFGQLRPSEQQAVLYREGLTFNAARLWGMRTAEGFSPSESATMRAYRNTVATPDESPPALNDLADFCRNSAVKWLLTTPARAEALGDEGLALDEAKRWGDGPASLVLERVRGTSFAHLDGVGQSRVWRPRPGFIRVDLPEGRGGLLQVSESWARGWRAVTEDGEVLRPVPDGHGFIEVRVPPGVTQVRMSYRPAGWGWGLALGFTGLGLLFLLLMTLNGWQRTPWLVGPAAATVVGCLVYLGVGVAARNHWACTFDEGFHLARGVARVETGDARMSVFHPPLQNMVCGYFATLAQGARLFLSATPGWRQSQSHLFATELAVMNHEFYPELVRAARWGTVLFGLLLCGVGVRWAHEMAGPTAAWLTAVGLGLNPTVLAHGHLVTTDMGVTALVMAGSYALWRAWRKNRLSAWFWAALAFTLAAMVKFTGLVWLLTFFLLCVPLGAWRLRRKSVLWCWPLSVLLFVALLGLIYGFAPQVIRTHPGTWLAGQALPAGRYIEGLLLQGQHAMEGHRGYLAGRQFTRAQWWYLPFTLLLKTPTLWVLAALAAAVSTVRTGAWRRNALAWAPLLVFAALLFGANHISIGVRHALPVLVFGLVAAAVWAARIERAGLRQAVVGLLVAGALLPAALAYPNYLSYFPAWAGGSSGGYRYLVDSNYDWGQDAAALEEHWAALTKANHGRPPRLVYYGFIDPSLIYDLPVSEPSFKGYMDYTLRTTFHPDTVSAWKEALQHAGGTAVYSISALKIGAYGMDLSGITEEETLGRIGHAYSVVHHGNGHE